MSLREQKSHSRIFLISTLLFAVGLAVVLVLPTWKRGRNSYVSYLPSTSTAHAAEVNSWTLAVEKVKADRGEPTGRQAKVDIPSQVRHYSDTRRFLAIQVAEVKEHRIQTPKDLVDLASMIKAGEMAVLPPVTENYILFGVGGKANKEPFTHYENRKSISLFNEAGLNREYSRIAQASAKFESELASLKNELSQLKKRDRAQRGRLQAQLAGTTKALQAERDAKKVLESSYGDADKREDLFAKYEALKDVELYRKLAMAQPGVDLENESARLKLKVRILSTLRPEALKVLEEVAASYRETFQRPLPITSLVRPDEYQHTLSKTNANATRIETPPHSTGLAFDILYRFMTAAEQSHVMAHLARLKDEGRIEVLRENRDHYHVFAFVDGLRPGENLIAASLGTRSAASLATPKPPKLQKQTHHSQKSRKSAKVESTRQRRVLKQSSKRHRRRTR